MISPNSDHLFAPVIFTWQNCPMESVPPLARTRRLPGVRPVMGKLAPPLSPSIRHRRVLPI